MLNFKQQGLVINVLGLLLLAYVISNPFNLNLLFYDSILTGGDGGSWQQIAVHLKESLIPHGRLFGWDQGNFFGYANLQHYFVLPFLIAVLLSYLLPLTIALKIVTVSGFFTLPFAVFWALRKLDYRYPIPLVGAWVSLAFLFHERFSMFGGNMLSTLAGEYCYSIAFTLMVLFLATVVSDIRQQKISLISGVLLGLVGLSHAFVFFISVLIPVFFLLNKPTRQTVKIIILVYFIGFLMMAFWVLPMLSSLNFTTPIKLIWRFPTLTELFQSAVYEVLVIALLCLFTFVNKPFRTLMGGFYVFMIFCSVILYLIASALHIPDIRFFPPLIFFSLLFIVDRCAILISLHKTQLNLAIFSLIGLSVIFGGSWVYNENNQAADWFEWNYSGYETKPAFIDGRADKLFHALRGSYSDPRVAWEQGEHDKDFGTGRVFENIPLFTGRASTEGIHYASSIFSLPITLLNGEFSNTPASPSANIYSHYFIHSLPERFEMLNIRDFIAFSPRITQLLHESDEFEVIEELAPYTLFRWKNYQTQYVVSPKYEPLLVKPYSDWKSRFTNWFRRGENQDISLVNGAFVAPELTRQYFSNNYIELNTIGMTNQLTKIPVEPASVINEKIANFSISFDTNKPGTPHIVKITYSPNWKSKNGEPIFMVAPGFMMIYPETQHVELIYTRLWSEYLGISLSLIGVLFVIFFLRRKNLLQEFLNRPQIELLVTGLLKIRQPFLVVLCCVVIYASVWSYYEKKSIYSNFIAGTALVQEGKLREAVERFKRNTSIDNIEHIDNVDIPTSMYSLARVYRDLGETELAKDMLSKLVYYYPRWIFIDEIYWHLGEIAFNQGKFDEASSLFEKCIDIEQIGVNAERCKKKREDSLAQLAGIENVN